MWVGIYHPNNIISKSLLNYNRKSKREGIPTIGCSLSFDFSDYGTTIDYQRQRLSTIGRLSDYRLLARFCFSAGRVTGTGRRAGPGGVSRLYFCGEVPVAVRFPLGVAGCVARELPLIAFPGVYRLCNDNSCIHPYQYYSVSFRALCAVSSGNRRYAQIVACIEIVHGAVAAVYRPQEQRKRIRCTSAAQTQKEPPHGADRAE